jgi:spore coat protein U-like protein
MKNALPAVFLLLLVLLVSGPAHAGSATAILDVNATVGVQCSASTTTLNFGWYNPGWIVYNVYGTITLHCPEGIVYLIGLDAGQNFGGSEYRGEGQDTRQMTRINGTEAIPYTLSPFSGYGAIQWGDGGVTYPYGYLITGTGDGMDQTYNVYGTMWPAGSTAPIADGIYVDLVGVTISY